MRISTLSLTSSSPDDLRTQLANLSLLDVSRAKHVTLSISGDRVLVQPFKMADIKIKDVKLRLQMVSVELLNLPVDQIAFDYQILSSNGQFVCGVFTCAPKSLVNEYAEVIKDSGLSPLKITAYILTSIQAFQQHNLDVAERFCLLDFSSDGYINLAVLHELRFELLRKVRFDNAREALFEIKQSLRSACAKSSVKHFDNVYFSGDIPDKDEVIKEIEETFDTKSLYKDEKDVKDSLTTSDQLFSINLINELVVPDREYRYMQHAMHGVIGVFVLMCLFGVLKINKTNKSIEELKNRGNQSIYSYSAYISNSKDRG